MAAGGALTVMASETVLVKARRRERELIKMPDFIPLFFLHAVSVVHFLLKAVKKLFY